MSRISEVYLSTLSAFAEADGLDRHFMPFMLLCENSGKLTQKELAFLLRRDKVSTMRIVDYLSDRGLVKRKMDESDRRCQLLEVTQQARDLFPKIEQAIQKTNALLLQEFTPDEKHVFERAMKKMYDTIETLPDPAFIVEAFKRKEPTT